MEAAILFKQIAKIEAHHRDRYKRCLEMVKNGTLASPAMAFASKVLPVPG